MGGELVLVTGAAGFVGSWVVWQLLDSGYRVRATVRSLKQEAKIQHLARLRDAGADLELVEADLLVPEGWDAACAGCDLVVHTASPFFIGAKKSQAEAKLYKPARDGTLNVLCAAQKAGTVKRVVVTSSTVAVIFGHKNPSPLLKPEDQWTDVNKAEPYSKSKTLAEMAAWNFVKEQKEAGKAVFELATVNPSVIVGPPLNNAYATSHQLPRQMLFREVPVLPDYHMGTVDVRDVALAHVRALQVPEAAGKRFIVQAKSTPLVAWSKVLGAEFKKYGYKKISVAAPRPVAYLAAFVNSDVAMMLPDIGRGPREIDCSLAKDVLGIEFRDVKASFIDHAYGCFAAGIKGFRFTKKLTALKDGAGFPLDLPLPSPLRDAKAAPAPEPAA